MKFREINLFFKHRRDKQILIVCRAGIQLLNLSEGYQYSSSLKKKSSLLG